MLRFFSLWGSKDDEQAIDNRQHSAAHGDTTPLDPNYPHVGSSKLETQAAKLHPEYRTSASGLPGQGSESVNAERKLHHAANRVDDAVNEFKAVLKDTMEGRMDKLGLKEAQDLERAQYGSAMSPEDRLKHAGHNIAQDAKEAGSAISDRASQLLGKAGLSASEMKDAAARKLEQAKDYAGDLKQQYMPSTKDAKDKASHLADQASSQASGALEGLRQGAHDIFDKASDVADRAKEALGLGDRSATSIAKDKLAGAKDQAANVASDIKDKANAAATDAKANLRDAAGKLKGQVDAQADAVKDATTGRLAGMRDAIYDRVEGLREGVMDAAAGVRDSVTGTAHELQEGLATKAHSAKEAIRGSVEDSIESLKPNFMKSHPKGRVEGAIDNIKEGIEQMKDKVGSAFGVATPKPKGTVESVKDYISNVGGDVYDKVKGMDIRDSLQKQAAAAASTGVGAKIADTFNKIKGDIDSNVQKIGEDINANLQKMSLPESVTEAMGLKKILPHKYHSHGTFDRIFGDKAAMDSKSSPLTSISIGLTTAAAVLSVLGKTTLLSVFTQGVGFFLHMLTGDPGHFDFFRGMNMMLVALYTLIARGENNGYDNAGHDSFLDKTSTSGWWWNRVSPKQVILTLLVCLWSMRAASYHILRGRLMGIEPMLRGLKTTQSRAAAWMGQAVAVALAALPVSIINSQRGNPTSKLRGFEVFALLLWVVGFGIEVVADAQKAQFLMKGKAEDAGGDQQARQQGQGAQARRPQNRDVEGVRQRSGAAAAAGEGAQAGAGEGGQQGPIGAVGREPFISTGLWKYSRHPNYVGEIIMWVAVYLFAFPSFMAMEHLAIISPLVVAGLILFVTGIPRAEFYADKHHGDLASYQAYKRHTPLLLPGVF